MQILYEDNHLLIVNKEAGVLVQGDKTGDTPLVDSLKLYLKEKYRKPGKVFLGVVHRLDRPVSGVVIFARTSKALERMNRLFKDRQVKKVYWALVNQQPEILEGTLVHWLIKDPKTNTVRAYKKELSKGLRAELDYRMKGRFGQRYLLEINPLTGRPHQIRVQLSAIACPIIGDIKYGYSKPNKDGGINLHAREITFEHPVNKEKIIIVAPLPDSSTWNGIKM